MPVAGETPRSPAGWFLRGLTCGASKGGAHVPPSGLCIRQPLHPAPGSTSTANPTELWIGSPIPHRLHGAEVVDGFRKHPNNGAREARPPENHSLQAREPAAPDSQPQGFRGSSSTESSAGLEPRNPVGGLILLRDPPIRSGATSTRVIEFANSVSERVELFPRISEAERGDSGSGSRPAGAAFGHRMGTLAGLRHRGGSSDGGSLAVPRTPPACFGHMRWKDYFLRPGGGRRGSATWEHSPPGPLVCTPGSAAWRETVVCCAGGHPARSVWPCRSSSTNRLPLL